MLLAMFSCVASAYAQSFTVDGLSYNVTKAPDEESPGEVEVTGGDRKEVIEFPEAVTYGEVTYMVTSIGSQAFYGSGNYPDNFTRKYIIPGTVRSIKNEAFYDNYYLEEVELNEGLQTIGKTAFGFNFVLKEIRIPSTVTSIGETAFITNQQNRATISCLAATPPALLGTETFKGRTDATLHVMTSDVEAYQEAEYWKDFSEIAGDKLYRDRCYSPVITCDDDLLTMSCKTEDATIYYTTDGSVPDENAIRYTSPISYTTNQIICAIAIAEGCENSRICSFYDKESLENVTDEQGVSYMLRQDSDGSYYYSVTGHTDELEAEIVIPDDLGGYPVRSIEYYAFGGCASLTSITIPGSVTSIGDYAFINCPVKDVKCVIMDYSEFCNNPVGGVFNAPIQLIDNEGNEITEYIIPEGVTSIGHDAFKNCKGLTSITIPGSVKSIGSYALWDCSSLRMVISKILTPFDISAFNDVSTNQATLIVPKDSRDDYKSVGGWNDFAFIYEEGETIYEKEQTDEQGVKYTLRQDEAGSIYYSVTGYTDELSAEVEIPADLGGCPVRNIGESAFSGCTNLESIVIPDSVTSIGNGAFKGCEILSSINIPNSVTSIGNEVFSGCTYLESITIPNSVTSIGDGAFRGCEALLSIVIRNSAISIGSGAFQGCVKLESFTLPSKMTAISNYAFSGCKALSTVKMGKNISSIGEYAFYGCSSLTSITLPDELESIGAGAFQNCALVSINIPESVTTIGASAFSNLPITSITIPYSVETIGSNAFSNNDNLTTIILEDGITEIVDGMFSGCGKLSFVSIPDGVDAIGNYAFQNCRSLTSIKLPETLTSMGSGVFNGSGLKFIELPNSFTDIPAGLFRNNSFQYIKLGSNVKRIGENAFGGNSALVIEIDMVTPPTIKSNVFPDRVEGDGDFAKITVIVPSANAETIYRKKAVWKSMTYANQGNMAEVTINTPGELSSEIYSQIGITAPTVVSLKVNGVINATDFTQILTNMKSLLRLDLSDCDITEIPDNALSGKTMLKELILPSKLQVIGKNAFKDCPYLTGNLDLPITLTSIGEYAFVGTKYTSVTLPPSLKTIGDYAFQNLPIEQKLTLPKVTSVGAHAFEGTNITGVTIPDGVTTIGDRAFANTPTEGHVTIPDGVTHLGNEVFSNTKISTVFLPNSVTMLSQGLFQGCKNLNQVYVPDNYTGMGNYAFDGCEALTTVRLSANTTTMGEYSMQGTPMDYVKVPSKVEVLSRGAFKNSKNLVSLALPASLKSVEAEALYGCTALRNLSVEAIEPPTIKGGSAIQGIHTDLCIISIPTQSFNAYMNAPHWGLFVQMRNDIAVETAGNGEITFESVEEEEEDEEEEVVYAKRRGTAQAKKRAPSYATPEDALTYANNGSSIFVPKNGKVLLRITPDAGEELVSATLDGKDIMPDIKDNVYIATADKANAKLVVKFSGAKTQQGDVNGDGEVNVTDIQSIANHILGKATGTFDVTVADMNGDGEVNVTDIQSVANLILGINPASSKARMPFELDPQ